MRRVLLIEDEADIRRIAAISLSKRCGWEVVAAGSGEEGLKLAADQQFDAILLDVSMPGMDGPTTLQELRRIPTAASTPVLFLTALTQAQVVQRLMSLEAAGVIPKPFNPLTLGSDIASRLGWGT